MGINLNPQGQNIMDPKQDATDLLMPPELTIELAANIGSSQPN